MDFMYRVLLLTSNCFENANANGLCALSLRDALNNINLETIIIGVSDFNTRESFLKDTIRISRVNVNNNSNSKWKEYIKSVKRLIKPICDHALVGEYVRYASKVIAEQKIDIVIALYYPIETLVAIKKLKTIFPDVLFASYELDSATDGVHPGGKGDKYFDRAYVRWMNNLYSKIDKIFIMDSHRDHFVKVYRKWLAKTEIVDIPILKNAGNIINKNNSDFIDFFYTGILDQNYRSPKRLLDCFCELTKRYNWRVHFYSRGNCEDMLRNSAMEHPGIRQHGYVSVEVLDIELASAAILLNIGNANSNSLPSKLISYISLGKPIIHFSSQKDDICIKYLNQYPLSLIIDCDDNLNDIKIKVTDFVNKHIFDRVRFEEIERIFYKNTPAYSAKKIVETVHRLK